MTKTHRFAGFSVYVFKDSSVERVNRTFCGDLYLSLFDGVAVN
jgi:hypothetical protein